MNKKKNNTSLTIAVAIIYALIACIGVTLLLTFLARGSAGKPRPTETLIIPSTTMSVTETIPTLIANTATYTPSVTEFPTFTQVVLPSNTPTRKATFTKTPSRTPTKTAASNSSATATRTRTATATATKTATLSSSTTATPTSTATLSGTSTSTFTATATPTPTSTSTATATSAPVTSAVFPVGPGGADVIPHQIIRTNNNFLYIFSSQQSSATLRVYRTNNPGFPNSASDFAAPITLTESNDIISVDAVYDGGSIIHVLINTQSGAVKDYPFDTSTNTFKSSITLASDGGTITASVLYVGTSGVSGMLDKNGALHVGYWTNNNHALHRAYAYDSSSNTLTPSGAFTQVDTAGSANHPSLAISPSDNSLTFAWVSEAGTTPQILTRTRSSAGSWGSVEVASTAPVWVSTANGLNIDQGPSLVIDSTGTKHMVYIEDVDSSVGDYGRIHYVVNSGSGWTDTGLNAFTHDPAIAINSSGTLYIIGHGHPLNTACKSMDDICTIQKSGGSWGNPVLFASPPSGFSFDASPSIKWSVVGFNRADVIEFIFFMTPYDSPTVYYGRLP